MSDALTNGDQKQTNPDQSMDDLDAILAEVQGMEEQATGQSSTLGQGAAGRDADNVPDDVPEEWHDPDLDAINAEISSALGKDAASPPANQDDPNFNAETDTDAEPETESSDTDDTAPSMGLTGSDAPEVDVTEIDPAESVSTGALEQQATNSPASSATEEELDSMMADLNQTAAALEGTSDQVSQLQEQLSGTQKDLDALIESEQCSEEAPQDSNDAPATASPPESPGSSDGAVDDLAGNDTSGSAAETASAPSDGEAAENPAEQGIDDYDAAPSTPDSPTEKASLNCAPGGDSDRATASDAAPPDSVPVKDVMNETFEAVRHNLETAMTSLQAVLQKVGEVQQEAVSRVEQAQQFKAVAERALDTGRQFSQAHLQAARARSAYEDAQLQAESLRQAWEDAQRAASEVAGLLE